jgi:archaellum biogenesis protein FlaJ (TadC family)
MRKVQFVAVFWTLVLATPLTAAAIILLAYTTQNLTRISTAVANFSIQTTAGGRGWVLEFAQRWPEVAGMVIGMMVLLTIFLFVRQGGRGEERVNGR